MEFIRNNADPQQLQGELGYYFSTLELAASFVKDLDKGQLAPLPPTMSGEPLVVCELGTENRFFFFSFLCLEFDFILPPFLV